MSDLKLLVHTCCAPCFIAPYNQLKDRGIAVSAFWFNPNIHPLLEYQKRRDTLREFCAKESIPLMETNEYGLQGFLLNTLQDNTARCGYCYEVRMEAVAKAAAEGGFEAFSTTLLYSRYQKHEMIIHIAKAMAAKYGVDFFYQDWRSLWQDGIRLSKEAGMYRQQYCGCIFSEEDRYREQIQRDKA
jgi:predicted adenine nucleotide alpha hydrolase (AANH) superfamily ATPase